MRQTPFTVRSLGLLALITVALVASGGVGPRASNLALAPGDPSPSMTAWTLDGDLQKIEWQGITLFNFWATWCEACRVEMPELQKLEDTYAEKGLRVFGMNRESMSAEQIREFVTDAGVTYPQLKPDKRLAKGWTGINVLPTTYLISDEGTIIRKYIGASTAQIEGMRLDIDNLVNGRPMGPMVIVKPAVIQTKEY
jgi:thiol-disulfide isomerase/thioredoxin